MILPVYICYLGGGVQSLVQIEEFFFRVIHWGQFQAWQMLRGLFFYVVQPNPSAPERLNDSYSVILSSVCVGVTCNKLWLDYSLIWRWFIRVEEPSSWIPSCNDVILHNDEDHCSVVIGSLCRVCSQWRALFFYRLVAGRRFPLEDHGRTIVVCIWLYELQNKFDESYMDSFTRMMSAVWTELYI